jgi:pimeloyl-ACP methyl ester carboxylesterase
VNQNLRRTTAATGCALALLAHGGAQAQAPHAERGVRGAPEIQGRDHYATRDGLRLYLWEKASADSAARLRAARAGRVVLLLHGATWTGRPDFDLQVRDYSLMDFLARHGYDAWALDVHGYGRSDTTAADWSEARTGAQDVAAAVDYIARTRGVEKVVVLGWSWGATTAGLYATQHPERVSKLVLYAGVWRDSPALRDVAEPTRKYRVNTDAGARSDFTDVPPGQAEPDVVDRYAAEALREAPRSPNGVVRDHRRLPILDPAQIRVPTLVIHGERDPIATEADLVPFFRALATKDKSYVMLPEGGHAVILERGHRRFQHAVLAFLERP